MNSQELRALQEAYNQVYELDEAEGSYGQTPTARKAYGDLTNKRRNTPAGEFAKRGDKKAAVKSASKHFDRTGNPDAGDRSKKSTKPDWNSGKRRGMTQSDRDHARGEAEYGHTGYDPDWNGPASGPGGKPKGKKLERQRKTGVSAESFDLYDVILSHLLDEGYADTEQAAEAIMVNMSEDWRESIVEESMPPRRSKEERSKRAKELGDRQTIKNVVGKYNKEKPLSKQENPDKYYSNN